MRIQFSEDDKRCLSIMRDLADPDGIIESAAFPTIAERLVPEDNGDRKQRTAITINRLKRFSLIRNVRRERLDWVINPNASIERFERAVSMARPIWYDKMGFEMPNKYLEDLALYFIEYYGGDENLEASVRIAVNRMTSELHPAAIRYYEREAAKTNNPI